MAESKPEFRTSRVFDAPKRLVWQAWTSAEYVQRWFTPKPLTTAECSVDLRPGGEFKVVMQMPGGLQHPMNATFTEVVAEDRIVFDAVIEGDLRVLTTVRFTERDGKTTLDVHQVYSRETPSTKGAPQGWKSTLDNLAEVVRTLA